MSITLRFDNNSNPGWTFSELPPKDITSVARVLSAAVNVNDGNNSKDEEMADKYFGSCLCGDVRFEVEGVFESFYLCHCESCRKDTGSAHAANLFSSTAKLKWVSGEDKVRVFTLPSTRHTKSFCSICGSALPNLQMNGGLLVVPAGSLNSELPIRPTAHIFVASKAGWDEALEELPMIERVPIL